MVGPGIDLDQPGLEVLTEHKVSTVGPGWPSDIAQCPGRSAGVDHCSFMPGTMTVDQALGAPVSCRWAWSLQTDHMLSAGSSGCGGMNSPGAGGVVAQVHRAGTESRKLRLAPSPCRHGEGRQSPRNQSCPHQTVQLELAKSSSCF